MQTRLPQELVTSLRDAMTIYEESLCSLSSSTGDSAESEAFANASAVAFPSNLVLRLMQHAIHVRHWSMQHLCFSGQP